MPAFAAFLSLFKFFLCTLEGDKYGLSKSMDLVTLYLLLLSVFFLLLGLGVSSRIDGNLEGD